MTTSWFEGEYLVKERQQQLIRQERRPRPARRRSDRVVGTERTVAGTQRLAG